MFSFPPFSSLPQIDEWLKKKSLPRLPLPNICGYVPSVRFIASAVKEKSASAKAVAATSKREDTEFISE